MLRADKLTLVMVEIERFNNRVIELQSNQQPWDYDERSQYLSSKYTAAVRRASLDLTRALADLRKGK